VAEMQALIHGAFGVPLEKVRIIIAPN